MSKRKKHKSVRPDGFCTWLGTPTDKDVSRYMPMCRCVIPKNLEDQKMTQENKAVPHIHAAIIGEWVKDTTRPVQRRQGDDGQWITCDKPHWHLDTQYRFKPRWFEMEQLWIAKGKPAVEVWDIMFSQWVDVVGSPAWLDDIEYRFKEVSRHAALRAEWEAKGKPARQVSKDGIAWENGALLWDEDLHYRIKPTPHPDADVLKFLSEDGSLHAQWLAPSGEWRDCDRSFGEIRLRIKQ